MQDTPSNNHTVRELLENSDVKYDNDVVVLDLATLYMLRPTHTKLPTSLGIKIPSDLSDAFDTAFIESMIIGMVEQGIHVTNTHDLLLHIEETVNSKLYTTYEFNLEDFGISEYVVSFYNILKELVDKYTVGYLNIYINGDKAHMQLTLRIWKRGSKWN